MLLDQLQRAFARLPAGQNNWRRINARRGASERRAAAPRTLSIRRSRFCLPRRCFGGHDADRGATQRPLPSITGARDAARMSRWSR